MALIEREYMGQTQEEPKQAPYEPRPEQDLAWIWPVVLLAIVVIVGIIIGSIIAAFVMVGLVCVAIPDAFAKRVNRSRW